MEDSGERNKFGKVTRTRLAMATCFRFTHSKVNSSKTVLSRGRSTHSDSGFQGNRFVWQE